MKLTRHPARLTIAVAALALPAFAIVPAAAASGGGTLSSKAAPAGSPASAAAGTISTVAGGPGGPGKATTIPLAAGNNEVCGVSFTSGAMYAGDLTTLRKVTFHTGWLTTPAGAGAARFVEAGDGGLATEASGEVCFVTTDHSGNLVFGDPANDRVRVVAGHTGTFYGQPMIAGHIYAVAGNGSRGFGGDGGPATKAEFYSPAGVTLDSAGNLVITDAFNGRIRVVAGHTGTFYGQHMTAGDIYTIAGDGTLQFNGDGIPATSAGMDGVMSPLFDGDGNLVFADSYDERVRVVAGHTGTFYGQHMTAGDIYTIAGNGASGYAGDGGPATSAELQDPEGIARDAAGNLLVADTANDRVRVVAEHTGTFYGRHMTAGDIYTVAGTGTAGFSGDGGPATAAAFNLPQGVAVDTAGNLLIADALNARIRVVAATSGTFYGQHMTAGDVYTVAGRGLTGEGDNGPALKAQLNVPQAVAVDAARNLVIADTGAERVRVLARSTGTFYGRAMTAGDIYTIAGNGKAAFGGDRGPATKAGLYNPDGVVLDAAGNVLIANGGRPRVRVVAEHTGTFYGQPMTAGDIYTIAGSGRMGFAGDGGPALDTKMWALSGIALDGAGNLLIADAYRIRYVPFTSGTYYGQAMTAKDIYTIAGHSGKRGFGFSGDGGPAIKARLFFPGALTVDGHGNLVIPDSNNNRVRVVAAKTGTSYGRAMKAGDIYTVAGDGTAGFAGDGGLATAAELDLPQSVAVDSHGNLVIGDTFNSAVRVVAVTSGRFYGQAMTAGHIYTVAGTGVLGFSGDGGPAASAHLDQPWGVAVDGSGLVIADTGNVRIRYVTG